MKKHAITPQYSDFRHRFNTKRPRIGLVDGHRPAVYQPLGAGPLVHQSKTSFVDLKKGTVLNFVMSSGSE